MATPLQTFESTANVGSTRAVRDVKKGKIYTDPNDTPFTIIAQKSKTRSATNTKVEWNEQDNDTVIDAINMAGNATDTVTTLVFDNGTLFQAGDIVTNLRTAEKFLISSMATHTATVVRAVDGDQVTGTAMLDNDDIMIIGNARAEGSALGALRASQEDAKYNYTQIIRHAFGATRSEQETENYTGETMATQARERYKEHKLAIERMGIVGERNLLTTGAGSTAAPIRLAGGALYYISTNSQDASGTLTESELETFCQAGFEATGGSSTKTLLTSPKVSSVINQLAAGRLEMVPSDNTFGISVKQYESIHGTLMLVKQRLLKSGVTYGYAGSALLLDFSKIEWRPLHATEHRKDVGVEGDDGQKDEYLTEGCFTYESEKCHGYLYGVTG